MKMIYKLRQFVKVTNRPTDGWLNAEVAETENDLYRFYIFIFVVNCRFSSIHALYEIISTVLL